MATIEKYAAKSVYDPPIYAQAVKVTGAQTILYIAGQVDYDASGNSPTPAISRRRPAVSWRRSRPRSRPAAAPSPISSR